MPEPSPWMDEAFGWQPALVAVQPADLFRLDPELERKLAEPALLQASTGQRLKRLLGVVFGPEGRGFAYAGGHSTTAAETWRNKSGDCLSLTVLTYAVARAMGVSAQMQEVQAPAIFDRRGQLDAVNQHVNVLFPRAFRDVPGDPAGRDIVVDFEPDFATGQRGTPLTEAGIVARYYNNIAVEHLARGRHDLAYAHFKAAIQAQPDYVASYGNLAVLYRRTGQEQEAERLLRRAVAMGGSTDASLHELHQLLVDQGRMAEARQYARRLEARRAADPYYWIGLGILHLQDDEPRRAIAALERARSLAAGFQEVHRYLAVAYARAGEPWRANQELLALASLGAGQGELSALHKKFKRLQP
ncbi:hypothetical protein UC35_00300 [Ramlibacter tataouinensis]|uniref:Uncharacterized protein n=2 Tax=Ramlibacter tataouinensis TaxID=94132 RepID=A0A127JNL7_9BURK|nr:hypothetical protein UC35_00300 [Ramlibacter tataouinensis]